jgi:hypothetical protein
MGIHKKWLTRHGGQPIKQVLKTNRKLKRLVSPKRIPQDQLQHNGIVSHPIYVNLQHCNVSLTCP